MATVTTTIVTPNQLGEHKTRQDLWVAVHGKVYDLTTFAADHPGGIDVLIECAGDDATEPFDYAGHTKEAFAAMAKFQVGRLEGSGEAESAPIATGVGLAAKKIAPSQASLAQSIPTTVLLSALVAACGLTLAVRHGSAIARELVTLPKQFASDQNADTRLSATHAFLGGLMLSSAFSFAGCVFLYKQWHKTLPHERNVFTYPSVIPRKRV